jgi:DNA polymerase III subunit gamma/tau
VVAPSALAGSPSGLRAVANGPPVSDPMPAPPRLQAWRDVVALVAERREPTLHAHLLHAVHLVRFTPPVIELRPEADAPRDLGARLRQILHDATGSPWSIVFSHEEGEPTLAEQGAAAEVARRAAAADHPLVRAILDTFPGAQIDQLHDSTLDAYGLPALVTEPEAEDEIWETDT